MHASVRVDATSERGGAGELKIKHDYVQKEETFEDCAQKEGKGGNRQNDEHLAMNTAQSQHFAYHILRHFDAFHFLVNLVVKRNNHMYLIAVSYECEQTEHAQSSENKTNSLGYDGSHTEQPLSSC